MAFSFVRILQLSTSRMQVLFNDDLDQNIGVTNISIIPQFDNVPDVTIRSVSIENSTLTINFSPLFPNIQYKVIFSSTSNQSFQTTNGEVISEDGNRNSLFISSPGEKQNDVRDSIFEEAPDIYPLDEPNPTRNILTTIANSLERASNDISTIKGANYLSIDVVDEKIERGDGPIDKLSQGGAFEILRVANIPTGESATTTLDFNTSRTNSFKTNSDIITNSILSNLTDDPISLQSIDVINETIGSDTDEANFFDGLTLRVSNKPVIQVISVTLIRDNQKIAYDIEQFGYALKTNRYDTDSASINVNLRDDEIELSNSSITGTPEGFVTPKASDKIQVSYIYRKLGRDISQGSVQLSTVNDAIREIAPPLTTKFNLNNAPIVTAGDQIPSTGGISFLNTQAFNGNPAFTTSHPAFQKEIKFDITRLPAQPGEFSVNYESGEVFVFGVDANNDGTGESPPAATYKFRKIFVSDLDFTFNDDRNEISINSTRGLSGIEAKVTFNFEDTFAEGEDFRSLSHVESLNERVDNRLIDVFKVRTKNFPVTNVFRILNETTGELYTPVRFNDTSITFTGRNAPRQIDVTRERASFVRVPQEILLVSDELKNSIGLRVFKINLENNGITDSTGRFIGANFDTSVILSESDLFLREFFFDTVFASENQNIDRLELIGDYSINYEDGIIYVAVSSSQDTDIGDITYRHKVIRTKNKNILDVNNIFRSSSTSAPNIKNFNVGNIEPTTVSVTGLSQVGERFINSNSNRILLVGTYQSGEDGVTNTGSNVFISNSAIFTEDDIGRNLRIGSTNQPPVQEVTITGIINDHEVLVSTPFGNSKTGRVWVILDTSSGAPKTITLENDIISVNDIYEVTQLGTLPFSQLDGYFDITRDSIDGNVITLGESNPLQVGDAVIVNYNFGDIFIDYRYLRDEIVISYEYGNNALDWSISNKLNEGDEYFVTYKYGALRDSLLNNFGALTQINQLTNFSPNLNRELYRDILSGTLQSFLEGPTIPSIERLVEAFTDVTPNITEGAFNNWILGRDFLHLRKPKATSNISFDLGKFSNGVLIDNSDKIDVPALAHLSVNEGTLESWVRPNWDGLSNDSTITFDSLQIDGYTDTSSIYIGFSANNPTEVPFSLNVDQGISVTGQPTNIDDDTGFFIWFDEIANSWQLRWRESTDETHSFDGIISTTGEFFNVEKPIGSDGYDINEITDIITSSIKEIRFEAFIDGYDIDTPNTHALDGISFLSGDQHYLFDMANDDDSNRMSILKDGTGYLNFQVFDNSKLSRGETFFYNISHNIRDWTSDELHHIAVSWKLNSADEKDELHLFVDGLEVPNLFKYGGNPKANSNFNFGDESQETIISSASRPIVGGNDGNTESGDNLFRSTDTNFEDLGILVGDSLFLLDGTADGTGDPNLGAAYTVTGVGKNTITVDRNFTLTLGNLNYTINKVKKTINTEVNFQNFIVIAKDSSGNETELSGLDTSVPDYSIDRGDNNTHEITINDNVKKGDSVIVQPLGLIFKRCKERIFTYGNSDTIRTNSKPPVTLGDVDITAITLPKQLLTPDGYNLSGTVINSQMTTIMETSFTNVCQPTNSSAGRKLAVTLSGDNIDYSIPGNKVTIKGTAFSGASQEIISFNESDTAVSSELWLTISSIDIQVVPIDTSKDAGIVEIKENKPITISENNGDKAEVVDFSNGIITLETFGTGGDPFVLDSCLYEIEYPTFLRIGFDGTPDTFQIGSDFNGNNQFDGIIDEFRILDGLSDDTRIGETIETGSRSVTTDFSSSSEFNADSNTLFLSHFNGEIKDSSKYFDRFNSGTLSAPSVNETFGTAALFDNSNPFIIKDDRGAFNNNEGTIEFWISPLDDIDGDPNLHYYLDMSASLIERVTSSTSTTVILGQRAREIQSVRLATDVFETGTNFFTGGSLSNVDRRTVTLGTPLPNQNVDLVVTFVPLSNQGDRVSIFRDGSGFINFFVKASGIEHLLSVPVSWKRHTWHRVMVMWKTNSTNNQDRLRLFVDGSERGTIKYGTGLIYGTGIVYGQAETRPGVNRFLVDNIDLTDTFSKIFIGSDIRGAKSARARMDNIRFSNIERLSSIKVTTSDTIDLNFNANISAAVAVVEDLFTTEILNFDNIISEVKLLSTVIDSERGLFRFNLEVIDSFDKVIGNPFLEKLLKELVNTIKPANTESIITFTE